VTVVEIVKREIRATGGKWFQYNVVGALREERTRTGDDEKKGVKDEDEAEDGAEEAFETMKTPFERSIEGTPKIRAIPTLTIYLSRIRIDTLRREYGFVFAQPDQLSLEFC